MIHEKPIFERPRERCLKFGSACLSLRECIAIILGSGPPGVGCLGLAHKILHRYYPSFRVNDSHLSLNEEEILHSFFTAMERDGINYLEKIDGLGSAKKAQLLAAFELGRKYHYFKVQKQTPLKPQSSSKNLSLKDQALIKIPLLSKMEIHEWLGFVSVFAGKKLGDFCIVEKGCRTHVNVDPIELFAQLLVQRPLGFFLFHNHPSGSLLPSESDYQLTQNVHEVCLQLGLLFYGHAIVTPHDENWIIL